MSGIMNQTGAVSGILGTTVGTPAAGATSGMVSNVFYFQITDGGLITATTTAKN